ncbi:MAG: hypothetical protein ABI700_30740, partial [Chloroflexota bacterium]
HLRGVLITQTAGADMLEASPDERALYTEQAAEFERGRLVRSIRAFNEAVNNFKGGWQPQLSLELALIDSFQQAVETVVQVVQQVAQSTVPAERPQVKQDATPSIPSAVINEKWGKVLNALLRYSKTGPDIMKYFRVQRVEGSTVYLCTDNQVYYTAIQPHPEKRKAVERALGDVFRAQMTVQVVMVSSPELEAINNGAVVESGAVDISDPLLSTGIELGAEIKRIDNS